MSVSLENGPIQSDSLKFVINVVTSRVNTYNIHVNPTVLEFKYFKSDNPNIDEAFEDIRQVLVEKGFIPLLREEEENSIVVVHRPYQKYRSNTVNIILFFLTVASTIYVGSIYSRPFISPGPYSQYWSVIYGFVFFSAPLLLILGLHELGHYFVAKRYHVKASFPFFIPIPISIGTLGAFISIRDPIPDRKSMVEIGAAGPIIGFATSIPMLFVANYAQAVFKPFYDVQTLQVNFPLIYHLLGFVLPHNVPIFPMVLAVWVGIFATAMNLLPVSQLDGGHIVRGILGKRATIVGYAFIGFILILSYYYEGWIFLVFFAIFLGLTHPPPLNDRSKIPSRDVAIGIAAIAMFVLSFTPIPII